MAWHRLILAVVVAVWGLPLAAGWGQAKAPQAAYLEFVAAARKATTVDQVVPYLSSEFRSMLQKQARAEAAKWLGGMKSIWAMTNFKVTKESISGDRCVLEATAQDASGRPSTGKVELVREKGVWKVDDEAWATPH